MIKEMRPTCINHGCDYQVAHSGTRWRPVCSRCHQAGYGKGTYREGVTPLEQVNVQIKQDILDLHAP